MRFDIITIFPEAFASYLNISILKRAKEKRLIDIHIHNLRDFAAGKHKSVDAPPYGGGPGMVFKIEPLARAVGSILKSKAGSRKSKVLVILFEAGGKQFNARMASEWTKNYDQIVMIAGHYEGVDERIKKVLLTTHYSLQTISIGP